MEAQKEKKNKTAEYLYLPLIMGERTKIHIDGDRDALTGKVIDISIIFTQNNFLYVSFETKNSLYQNVPVYIPYKVSFPYDKTLALTSVITDKFGNCYGLNKIMGITENGIFVTNTSGEYLVSRFNYG